MIIDRGDPDEAAPNWSVPLSPWPLIGPLRELCWGCIIGIFCKQQ